jgi:5-methylcytosine-specific restriction protein B
MTENLKKVTTHLIEKYIKILEDNGEPNEAYKYLAFNTFQQNWDLESKDFYKMFRNSFSKVSNLLYQNSWGFIEKSAQNFPEETRAMFSNLYDESHDVTQRIKTFQSESEKLLLKVKQVLNRTNINAQQDERTISVYLAFRFPEKYMLYKADYYKNFCEQLNIKSKKSGERFLHLQELANQIIQEDFLDENFINTYRKFYQKPDWDDKYLMIQNVLFVVFRDAKNFNLLELFKKFD